MARKETSSDEPYQEMLRSEYLQLVDDDAYNEKNYNN